MATITLHLWVSNQDAIGADCDQTRDYIYAANWTPPEGVAYDDGQTISGEAEATYAAFRALAVAVKRAGHGVEDQYPDEEIPAPELVACPEELLAEGYTPAAASLARIESRRQKTYAAFAAAVPALAGKF